MSIISASSALSGALVSYQPPINSSACYFLPHFVTEFGCQDLDYRQSITEKFNEFTKALEQKVSEDSFSFSKKKIKLLRKLFNSIMTEENPTIKTALTKKEGYLLRLFSQESWDEWTERKTELGRVVTVFEDFMEGQVPLTNIMQRVDVRTIEKAISQAKDSLKLLYHQKLAQDQVNAKSDCRSHLLFGGVVSVMIGNKAPLTLATLSCFDSIVAQSQGRTKEQIMSEIDEQRRSCMANNKQGNAPLSNSGSTVPVDAIMNQRNAAMMNLFSELIQVLPHNLEKFLKNIKEKGNWFEAILDGVTNVFLDFTGISTPNKLLEEKLQEMEKQYWLIAVKPKYLEIFPLETRQVWSTSERHDLSYEIKQMREKLVSYGYNAIDYGTPLDFLEYLKKMGRCEGGQCIYNKRH